MKIMMAGTVPAGVLVFELGCNTRTRRVRMQHGKRHRTIKKVWKSNPTLKGAGVHLKRAFAVDEVPQFDPFLLLDAFRSDNPADYRPGFPWHPHRGMETITYVLAGAVEHGDSLGNRGIIAAGDVQWMTAGSGIIHQEMPKGDGEGRMLGFQLWANLPTSQKMMASRYREVQRDDIPQVTTADGAAVCVIAGEVAGVRGPVREIVTDSEFLDVSLPPRTAFTHPVKAGYTVFAYVIAGEGYVDPGRDAFAREAVGVNYFDMARPCACGVDTLVLYGPGDSIIMTTEEQPVRFLLVAGRPLQEPVAWYGPIVMNTQEELRVALREYEQGSFVKHSQR
jgi:quercetin 2,3-dioxygenase